MRYSNQHDEKLFTIERESREDEVLPNIEIEDIVVVSRKEGRVNIEIEQDAIDEKIDVSKYNIKINRNTIYYDTR